MRDTRFTRLAVTTLLFVLASCSGGNREPFTPVGGGASAVSDGSASKSVGHQVTSSVSAAVRPAFSNGGPPQTGSGSTYVGTVGQAVYFGVVDQNGNAIPGCSISGFPAGAVGGYSFSNTSAFATPAQTQETTNQTYIQFYFSTPASGALTATCNVNGQIITAAPASFTVTAPTLVATASYGNPSIDKGYSAISGWAMHWGQHTPYGSGGINWAYSTPSAPLGQISIFQFVNAQASEVLTNGTTTSLQNTGGYVADNGEPYGSLLCDTCTFSAWVSSGSVFKSYDAPAYNLTGASSITMNEQFTDYFMYWPNGGIPVAIGEMSWGWSGSVHWQPANCWPSLKPGCGLWNSTGSGWPIVSEQTVASPYYGLPVWYGSLSNQVDVRNLVRRL